jgi:hypothetical protein
LRLLDTLDPKPHNSGSGNTMLHSPHGAVSGGRHAAAVDAKQQANKDSAGSAGFGFPAAADQVGGCAILLLLLVLQVVDVSSRHACIAACARKSLPCCFCRHVQG